MNPYQIAILNALSRETERSAWEYCKCARVLAFAAESTNSLDSDSKRRLFTEGEFNAPEVEELYGVLIDLVNNSEFVTGQGNFGRVDSGPADPLFTECCLTPEGKALVATWNPASPVLGSED